MENKNHALDALADSLEIDTEMLKEILILFFENMPGQIDNMRTALSKEDFSNLHIISHTLKGTAANLMYTNISSTAAEVEKLAVAKHEDAHDYEAYFNKLSLLLSQAKMKIFY